MRNIWSFLIGQFLLPTCVAFFHSKNQWKGGKKCYLVTHAYCSTECCTNCHCPSARSKTALLFPGLIAPLWRIHVQYTLYFWIQSVRYILLGVETIVNLYFCGNVCFAKQVMAQTEVHDWLKLQWDIYHLLTHYFSLYLSTVLSWLSCLPWPCTNHARWLGWGELQQLISGELLFYTCHV